ncbi:MAG: hypothetical protein JSR59_10485 [Proteobacteria bacterium]|nr:hypothetical protein [Pseudomonadota bacterium]
MDARGTRPDILSIGNFEAERASIAPDHADADDAAGDNATAIRLAHNLRGLAILKQTAAPPA